MTLSMELEIKTLLEEFRHPEVVAEKLVKLFEDHPEDWSAKSLQELSSFLMTCGLYKVLIGFCLRHFSSPRFVIPWPYFIDALVKGSPDLEEEVLKFVAAGIEEEHAANQVCLAEGASRFLKKAPQWRNELKRQRLKNASELKQRLLDDMLTLRTQQLYEQEKQILGKLQRMFPGDQDILDEVRQHKERYALDILSRRSPLARSHSIQEAPATAEMQEAAAAFSRSLLKAAEVYPEMAFDFAVAAYTADDTETALALLENIDLSPAQFWFFLEVKIKCRRFLEVLNELNVVELKLAHEPETFFATAYLRAQAYWGLQQRHTAIEILESLLNARPNYRSGSTLLELWRTQ